MASTDRPTRRRRPVVIVLLVVALALCAALFVAARSSGAESERDEQELAARAVRTEAVVVSDQPTCSSVTTRYSRSRRCTVMVRFDAEGESRTAVVRGPENLAQGDRVTVSYDQARPSHVVLGTTVGRRLSAEANSVAIAALAGVCAFAAGLRRHPRTAPGQWPRRRLNTAVPFIGVVLAAPALALIGFWWGVASVAGAFVVHEALRRTDRLEVGRDHVGMRRLFGRDREVPLAAGTSLRAPADGHGQWRLECGERSLRTVPATWADPEQVARALAGAVRGRGGSVTTYRNRFAPRRSTR